MPGDTYTTVRGIRVPDHEWTAFQQVAKQNGETASVVARRLFREYVRENDPKAFERLQAQAAKAAKAGGRS